MDHYNNHLLVSPLFFYYSLTYSFFPLFVFYTRSIILLNRVYENDGSRNQYVPRSSSINNNNKKIFSQIIFITVILTRILLYLICNRQIFDDGPIQLFQWIETNDIVLINSNLHFCFEDLFNSFLSPHYCIFFISIDLMRFLFHFISSIVCHLCNLRKYFRLLYTEKKEKKLLKLFSKFIEAYLTKQVRQ